MTRLENYGWNSFHQQSYIVNKKPGHTIGRVISIKGFKYFLITDNGELETELSGKLLFGSDSENLPKVGDWVSYLDYGEIGYIGDVLPRTNFLSRRNPGNKTERQILGTNIDFALIVQGLDRDFNLMRLERYLTQVTSCGIVPIVILNKADLVTDLAKYQQEVLKLKRDCKLFFCSTLTGFGIQEFKNAFEKGMTYILIGSSGVGKSSLLNLFMNDDLQKTQAVSTFNSKGTHTTTSRDLFQLNNGSLLIDTPGMREFGITNEDAENSDSLFPVIEEFTQNCRYSDCKHLHEEGCAVLSALQSGMLDRLIYESYVKLMKEQKRFEINIEDKKRLNKQFGKLTKEAKNYRKKYKY
ncbi:MAG TPA: ribosome small subunit-dependent GTPase A [Chryseolinea sp.]|nr:ribosome small subunit-dependent GTPase A [Chryseolinea sp.]